MKKSNRELNIFSMSTLDLFASAMGAFILITLVLFPYVLNTGDSEEREAQVKAQLEKQLAEIKAQFEEREAEIKAQREERIEASLPDTGISEEQVAEIKAQLKERVEALRQQVAILQEVVDSTSILLGIKTQAKKFVFAIDMSGSMRGHGQSMILSVEALLDGFKTEMELAMIGFGPLRYWPANRTYFQVNQNTRNRVMSQVKGWMRQVDGGTPTFEALKEALVLNPEEIILLTDGQPSTGQYGGDWRSIVNTITRLNTQKIPIHAIAIGDYLAQGDFVEFLIELTKRNDGTLVGPKPG